MAWKKLTFDWKGAAWHAGVMVFYLLVSNGLYGLYHEDYMLSQPDIVQFIGMSQERKSFETLTGEELSWSNAMFGGMPTYQIGGSSGGFNWAKSLRLNIDRLLGGQQLAAMMLGMLAAYLLALALGMAPWWAATAGVAFALSTVGVLYLGAGHNSKVNAIYLMPGVVAGVLTAYQGKLWKGLFLTAFFTSLHLVADHLQMTYYLLLLLGAIAISKGVWSFQQGELKRFFKVSLLLALAGGSSALPSLLGILNTQQYSKFTTRGEAIVQYEEDGSLSGEDGWVLEADEVLGGAAGQNSGEGLGDDYILEYSMSSMEWLAVMCPNFKGGSEVVSATYQGQRLNIPVYWGEQKYSAGAFYFGVLIMVFFFAFLFLGKHWLRWPFAVMTALAIFLSWREVTFFTDFFLHYVPLFNKFRDTKMILVIIQVMSGAGALLMLKQLADWGKARASGQLEAAEWKSIRNRVAAVFGAMLGLFVMFYAVPDALLSFAPELRQDMLSQLDSNFVLSLRLEVFRADVLRTLGLMVVALAIVAALLHGKVNAKYVAFTFLLVTSLDLWNVNFRYHDNDLTPGKRSSWISKADYSYPFRPTPAHLKILDAERPSGEAFESAKSTLFEAYKDMFPRRLRPEDKELLTQIASFEAMRAEGEPFRVLKFSDPYIDTETSYFFQSIGGYHGAKLQRYQDFMEVILSRDRSVLQAASESKQLQAGLESMWGHRMLNTRYLIVTDEDVLPMPPGPGPAWFVQEVTWAKTSNDEIIKTREVDSFDEAVVPEAHRDLIPYLGPSGANQVRCLRHDSEYIEYAVSSEQGGLMVCSEVYYPLGWKAYIDGEPAKIARANFLFRAVSVPPGEHRVELVFEDDSSAAHNLASLGGAASLIFLLFALVWSFREDQTSIE